MGFLGVEPYDGCLERRGEEVRKGELDRLGVLLPERLAPAIPYDPEMKDREGGGF